MTTDKPWYVYMVRSPSKGGTSLGALYTGITTDINRRIQQHNNGTGSRAIRALGRPVNLVYLEENHTKSSASQREHRIKQMSKQDKEVLVATCNLNIY